MVRTHVNPVVRERFCDSELRSIRLMMAPETRRSQSHPKHQAIHPSINQSAEPSLTAVNRKKVFFRSRCNSHQKSKASFVDSESVVWFLETESSSAIIFLLPESFLLFVSLYSCGEGTKIRQNIISFPKRSSSSKQQTHLS